jgi:hypothetical protein
MLENTFAPNSFTDFNFEIFFQINLHFSCALVQKNAQTNFKVSNCKNVDVST